MYTSATNQTNSNSNRTVFPQVIVDYFQYKSELEQEENKRMYNSGEWCREPNDDYYLYTYWAILAYNDLNGEEPCDTTLYNLQDANLINPDGSISEEEVQRLLQLIEESNLPFLIDEESLELQFCDEDSSEDTNCFTTYRIPMGCYEE